MSVTAKWSLAVWMEDGVEEEGVIPSIWVDEGKWVRWPVGMNAVRALKELRNPEEKWERFRLIKVKCRSDNKTECEEYDLTTTVESSDGEEYAIVGKRQPKQKTMTDFVIGHNSYVERKKSAVLSAATNHRSSTTQQTKKTVQLPKAPNKFSPSLKDNGPGVGQSGTQPCIMQEASMSARPRDWEQSRSRSPRRQSRSRSPNPSGSTQPCRMLEARMSARPRDWEQSRSRSPRRRSRSRSPNPSGSTQQCRIQATSMSARSRDWEQSRSRSPRRRSRSRSRNPSGIMDNFPMSTARFQRKVLFALTAIRKAVEKIPSENHGKGMTLVKLKSMDELRDFEEKLEDPENYKSLKISLSDIGGVNAGDHAKRAMEKMLHNSVMARVNLTGKKGKFRFKDTKLYKAITETVISSHPGSTECVLEDHVQRYLKYAPERAGGGGRREKQ